MDMLRQTSLFVVDHLESSGGGEARDARYRQAWWKKNIVDYNNISHLMWQDTRVFFTILH